MAITPLSAAPAAPSLSDQENFDSEADAFVAWMAQLEDDFNANVNELNTVGASAASAIAAANAELWVSGTAISEGDGRYSPTDYQSYRATTDISSGANTTDPAADTSGNWVKLSSGGLTANEASSAVDITLTSSSDFIQAITMTAAAKEVDLPDATTLTNGWVYYIHANKNSLSFNIVDNSGSLLGVVSPGELYVALLADNGSAAGSWIVQRYNRASKYYAGASYTDSELTSKLGAAKIDNDSVLIAWVDGSSNLKAQVVNTDGTSGAVETLQSGSASTTYRPTVCMMSATEGFVTYADTVSGTKCAVYYFSVSGNTVTGGNKDTSTNTLGGHPFIIYLSATQALVCWINTTSLYGSVVTWTGTTPTLNTEVQLLSSGVAAGSYDRNCVPVRTTDTQAICFYTDTNTDVSAFDITVTGTTPAAANNAAFISSITAGNIAPIKLGNNIMCGVNDSGTSPYSIKFKTMSISSGAKGTAGPQVSKSAIASGSTHLHAARTSDTSAVFAADQGGNLPYYFQYSEVIMGGDQNSASISDFAFVPGYTRSALSANGDFVGELNGSLMYIDTGTTDWEIIKGSAGI